MGIWILAALMAVSVGDADTKCALSTVEHAQVGQTTARFLATGPIEPQRRSGWMRPVEGCVLYRIRVSAEGTVAAVVPVRTAGHPRVEEMARPVVMAIRYRRSDGEWLGLVRIRVKLA